MNNSVDSHARSMSIRAKANNLAKKTGISPQAALQAYFTERFLARLSRSEYASSMIIKGGTRNPIGRKAPDNVETRRNDNTAS